MTKPVTTDHRVVRHRISEISGRTIAERLGHRLAIHVSEHYKIAKGVQVLDFSSCTKFGCVELRPTARKAYLDYLVHGSLGNFRLELEEQNLNADVIHFTPGTGRMVGETVAESVR